MGKGKMAMREKLIELIRDAKYDVDRICVERDWCDGCPAAYGGGGCKEVYIADHLIANGVTISKMETVATDNNVGHKWIPVAERLPEVVDTYLVVVKCKYDWEKEYEIATDVATYNPYEKAYIDDCWNTYIDWDEGQQYIHVTHWMPLPEPPKEVE